MAYFVGWIANTLPLPGGVGGVEGGLIGSFSAFGVNVQAAVLAVLAYRAISFWLPTIPGAIAYLQLRRTVQRWRQQPVAGLCSFGVDLPGNVASSRVEPGRQSQAAPLRADPLNY